MRYKPATATTHISSSMPLSNDKASSFRVHLPAWSISTNKIGDCIVYLL